MQRVPGAIEREDVEMTIEEKVKRQFLRAWGESIANWAPEPPLTRLSRKGPKRGLKRGPYKKRTAAIERAGKPWA